MNSHLDTTAILAFRAAPAPRVLIVDDDSIACEHLTALVTKAEFEVCCVSNGAAALAALSKERLQIVITDRDMPDMDGLTLCRTIRDEHFDHYVYVILLTRHDSEQDVLSGFAAGADDYFSKRGSAPQLLARLRTAKRIVSLEGSLRSVIESKTQLSVTDALTGISNRRHFHRSLQREIRRVERLGGKASLLLIDLDHFKQINDRYGHAAGDEVLQEIARRLSQSLPRAIDLLSRVGGEEFAVILPDTDTRGAAVVAERLRQHVAATAVATSAGPIPVTASIGVSGIGERARPGPDAFQQLFDAADRGLYASKRAGRDRVTIADPSFDEPSQATPT